jgi:predicted dehydrogenase
MKVKAMDRRQFIKRVGGVSAAAVGFPYIVRSSALGADGTVMPSERVTMGCIGVGGQGTHNMNAFMQFSDVQIVAVCDVERGSNLYRGETFGRNQAKEKVDAYYAQKGGGAISGCEAFEDFRELLDRREIDAVTVCTPDHWHGVIGVLAARAGKDVYCENPLANTVLDGREICEAVKRYGRILQTGSHERSNDSVRYACELVRNGRIGKLQTVRVNMPCDEPHHQQVRDMAGPHPDMTVPRGFNYDMWLGPADDAPYTEKRCHFWWRFILEYGGGEMTDRGAHIIDLAQFGNGTDDTGPIEVTAKGKRLPRGLFNVFMEYEFELKYANGVRVVGASQGTRGLKFEGDKGWIFIHIHGGELEAEPASLLKEVIRPGEIRLGRSAGHHRDFLDAVKARTEPVAPAEVGHRTSSICHLINIAMLTEQTLTWDPTMERITNNAEADRMLSRPFRSPWHI